MLLTVGYFDYAIGQKQFTSYTQEHQVNATAGGMYLFYFGLEIIN